MLLVVPLLSACQRPLPAPPASPPPSKEVLALQKENKMLKEQIAALKKENAMLKEIIGPPPKSLDQFYPPQAPAPVFTLNMMQMEQAMDGTIADLMQGDKEGAVANWERFKQKYAEVSKMVPEWTDRFPTQPLAAAEEAVKAGAAGKFMAAFQPVLGACGSCHLTALNSVRYKYHWPDFEKVMVDDPISQKKVPFPDFMYTLGGLYTGIGNELAEGQLDNARRNYQGFKAAFNAMAEACSQCHKTARKYFVDEAVRADIEALGKALEATPPDMKAFGGLMPKIGEESCGDCHLVHFPAAKAKEIWEKLEK